jgi:gas vesicle protein
MFQIRKRSSMKKRQTHFSDNGSIIVGAVIGAVLGTAIGFLLAEDNRDTREKIKKTAENAEKKIHPIIDELLPIFIKLADTNEEERKLIKNKIARLVDTTEEELI